MGYLPAFDVGSLVRGGVYVRVRIQYHGRQFFFQFSSTIIPFDYSLKQVLLLALLALRSISSLFGSNIQRQRDKLVLVWSWMPEFFIAFFFFFAHCTDRELEGLKLSCAELERSQLRTERQALSYASR